MIQINNLTQSIQGRTVFEKLTVSIKEGHLTSLIGPNGAGKSTLLSSISRILNFEKGSIKLEGRDILSFKNNDLAKKLSILKQTNHTDMNITVEQLVQFGRFPYSKGRLTHEDIKHIDEALNLLKLQDLKNRNIKTLSGGQRQRAYIAMTIAQDTDYILLDEPLNNLDMKHSVQIMTTLKDLCRKLNKTIVVVLHDINFASCYSDDIIAMKDGKIVAYGEKEDVIQKDILKNIYDIDLDIEIIKGQRFCFYFNTYANE